MTSPVGSLLRVALLLWAVGRTDACLAVATAAAVPLLLLVVRASRGALRRRWREVNERETATLGVVQGTLSALRVARAFGREAWAARRPASGAPPTGARP